MPADTPTPTPSDQQLIPYETPERRAAIISSYRAFADFLEQRPEIPAPDFLREQYSVVQTYDPKTFERIDKTDAEKIAIVRRVAALLDVEVVLTEKAVYCEYPVAERATYTVHANLGRHSEAAAGGEQS